ncbi:MAG TPA: metallophosphoesterase [Levilinea sp.]|nr:metallophosphoesterase [Levilinea sp.]
MKILAVSDEERAIIYNPAICSRFGDIGFVISCGDLPYYYLEYIISMLNKPLYYVRGNHAVRIEFGDGIERAHPWGGINLHRRCIRDRSGLLLAGIEGCLQYNFGPQQYSDAEMWKMVWGLAPRFLWNKLRYGRFVDIFVTHAAPWKVHDQDDRAHRGVKAFRWVIDVFKPAYLLHGHVHVYRRDTVIETVVRQTCVMNVFGYREIDLDPARSAVVSSSC